MSLAANPRQLVLRLIFIGMGLVLIIRLFFLQLFEDKYKIMANDIAIYKKIVYPPRGIIYDRKKRVMCYNEAIFDLMVTANDVPKDFDSSQICKVLGLDGASYHTYLERAKWMNGPRRQGTFLAQLSPVQTARFQENLGAFPGFQLVERNIRSYTNPTAGVMLGYIGEISPDMMKKPRFASYQQGDYIGIDGLELKYEEVLRGQRGVYFLEKDNYNRPRDSYKKGELDTPAIPGRSLQLYVDEELQQFGEKLMHGKLGSIVAIDPKTGGILAMVSSPSYDPNLLRGSDRSRNFAALYKLATKPLFNRAMKAFYSPGSTQKPMTALIGLDVGAITPSFGYPCRGGYYACGRKITCLETWPGHAANLRTALANSCNSYFCDVYRRSVDLASMGGVKNGLHVWYQHMYNFGFGHPTGVDLPYEIGGNLYDVNQYDKMYHGVWNSCTNVFLGMGQGELSVTPIQMANAMCIVANHGYYYTPHLVHMVDGNANDSSLKPYLEKRVVTHIADTTFTIVGLGMMDVVDKGTARVAKMDGVEVCAKTGTVENFALVNGVRTKLANHSMFVAFAPRVNPKICIAVTVENAGFGATWAGPIASLMIEKYLYDSIATKRKPLEEKMMQGSVMNKYIYIIDSNQRKRDMERIARRITDANLHDSLKRAHDSILVNWYAEHYLLNKKKK